MGFITAHSFSEWRCENAYSVLHWVASCTAPTPSWRANATSMFLRRTRLKTFICSGRSREFFWSFLKTSRRRCRERRLIACSRMPISRLIADIALLARIAQQRLIKSARSYDVLVSMIFKAKANMRLKMRGRVSIFHVMMLHWAARAIFHCRRAEFMLLLYLFRLLLLE